MNDHEPIFKQIIEIIENDIISGKYPAEGPIASTPQIAKSYSINQATAVKAVSKLADTGILYKKRGIGMYVSVGAREIILRQRKEALLNSALPALLKEAERLGISAEQLASIIRKIKI
ncbi:MAG: GntR family transcriptional regulator, partial [Firmicutes bacterium]|nr:GntR family transcriptional regulator [Bacillota bacterium]